MDIQILLKCRTSAAIGGKQRAAAEAVRGQGVKSGGVLGGTFTNE